MNIYEKMVLRELMRKYLATVGRPYKDRPPQYGPAVRAFLQGLDNSIKAHKKRSGL